MTFFFSVRSSEKDCFYGNFYFHIISENICMLSTSFSKYSLDLIFLTISFKKLVFVSLSYKFRSRYVFLFHVRGTFYWYNQLYLIKPNNKFRDTF